MTGQQRKAIWEMWRQGLHRLAARAEQSWENGETFVLDASIRVPRMLKRLIDQCNWQSTRANPPEEDKRQANQSR